MSTILVVGASKGLGLEIVKKYATNNDNLVIATCRSSQATKLSENVKWVPGVDLATEQAGTRLVAGYPSSKPIDILIITAGYFASESFDKPDWAAEVEMYKISAIGPVFIVHHLAKAGLLTKGAKVILVSSESGSVTLRHESEGGGNYAHHASKSALNMVGKLLSLDLSDREIAVGMVHPGFMRTEMTKSVGFDKYYDAGGAVTPDVAAASLVEFVDTFNMEMTGEYWAPRGSRDIGTAEPVLGKELPTPLRLPW